MTTVILIDGREVDSGSDEWRQECLQRQRHVDALVRLAGLSQREEWKAYVQAVRRNEGDVAAERVKQAFGKAWDALHPPG